MDAAARFRHYKPQGHLHEATVRRVFAGGALCRRRRGNHRVVLPTFASSGHARGCTGTGAGTGTRARSGVGPRPSASRVRPPSPCPRRTTGRVRRAGRDRLQARVWRKLGRRSRRAVCARRRCARFRVDARRARLAARTRPRWSTLIAVAFAARCGATRRPPRGRAARESHGSRARAARLLQRRRGSRRKGRLGRGPRGRASGGSDRRASTPRHEEGQQESSLAIFLLASFLLLRSRGLLLAPPRPRSLPKPPVAPPGRPSDLRLVPHRHLGSSRGGCASLGVAPAQALHSDNVARVAERLRRLGARRARPWRRRRAGRDSFARPARPPPRGRRVACSSEAGGGSRTARRRPSRVAPALRTPRPRVVVARRRRLGRRLGEARPADAPARRRVLARCEPGTARRRGLARW